MGLRTVLDVERDWNSNSSAFQPGASRYTDCVVRPASPLCDRVILIDEFETTWKGAIVGYSGYYAKYTVPVFATGIDKHNKCQNGLS